MPENSPNYPSSVERYRMLTKRFPDPLDQLIGRNIRLHRLKAGLSQSALGAPIGITFQQIQKYENATNRVSASRLVQIARALGVPISTLLDEDEKESKEKETGQPRSRECRRRLMRAGLRITDPHLINLAVEVTEAIAKLSAR